MWGLSVHEELECYPKEHGKGAYLLKYGTQGVSLMDLHNGQLFSCGGDGTVKWRQLSVRETIVNSKLPWMWFYVPFSTQRVRFSSNGKLYEKAEFAMVQQVKFDGALATLKLLVGDRNEVRSSSLRWYGQSTSVLSRLFVSDFGNAYLDNIAMNEVEYLSNLISWCS